MSVTIIEPDLAKWLQITLLLPWITCFRKRELFDWDAAGALSEKSGLVSALFHRMAGDVCTG